MPSPRGSHRVSAEKMTNSERVDELKELKKSSGHILSDADSFNEWTGRASGLLGFDPILRHKFDALCDQIHNEQEGGRWKLYENVLQVENKMHAIVSRAISDLEINRPDVLFSIPKHFPIPDPVVIPDAAGFGCPDIELTRDADNMPISTKPIVVEYNHPLPADRDIPKTLTKDHGLFWLVMHCHWLVRVKAIMFFFALFAVGVQAAQSQDFMWVWTRIVWPVTQAMKLLNK